MLNLDISESPISPAKPTVKELHSWKLRNENNENSDFLLNMPFVKTIMLSLKYPK